MAAGMILTAAGAAVYFLTAHRVAGILLMIAGVAILVISFSISGVLFRADIVDQMKKRDRERTNGK